jgi:hypothetical protein
MENQQKSSKALDVCLWTAQIILAIFLLMGAVMKFMPIEEIARMMPWTGEIPAPLVRLLGLTDLLAAIGLVMPAMLHTKVYLTYWAAIGSVVLMLSAIIFHVSRGEASVIGFNVFLFIVALFIAWGRWRKPLL